MERSDPPKQYKHLLWPLCEWSITIMWFQVLQDRLRGSAGFLIPPHRTCMKCSVRTRVCIHKYCTNSSWLRYYEWPHIIETADNYSSWSVIGGYEVLVPSIHGVCLYACQTTPVMELAYSFSLINIEFAVSIVQINLFPSINPYLEVVIFRWIISSTMLLLLL